MKAIIYTQYGPPEVLQLQDVEKPTPKAGEVLIKVRAATVTAGDVNIRGFTFVPPGFKLFPRLIFGLFKPKIPILGTEIAGDVEAVGEGVTDFQKGDPVFGIGSNRLGAGGVRELFYGIWTSLAGGKKVHFGSSDESKQDLLTLKELAEQGAIRPVIDRRYSLEHTAEAHRYVETWRKRGSVVIEV
jgi:NADPH:quinone reductase-like Zn-dependent oxidoreductase